MRINEPCGLWRRGWGAKKSEWGWVKCLGFGCLMMVVATTTTLVVKGGGKWRKGGMEGGREEREGGRDRLRPVCFRFSFFFSMQNSVERKITEDFIKSALDFVFSCSLGKPN